MLFPTNRPEMMGRDLLPLVTRFPGVRGLSLRVCGHVGRRYVRVGAMSIGILSYLVGLVVPGFYECFVRFGY